MGDFVIYKRNGVSDLARNSILKTLSAQGSRNPRIIEDESYSILIFEKNISPVCNYFENDNSEFCASSGCFFYKGKSGEHALSKYLQDFDPRRFTPAGFMGVFTLILKKAGRLYVVTDPMGASRIFHNLSQTLWSSSFLTIAESTPCLTPDPQGIYEYTFQETTYGNSTPVNEIKMADSFYIFELNQGSINKIPKNIPVGFEQSSKLYEELLEEHAMLLQDQMKNITAAYAPRIATALSGGYDSRLMLSLLLQSGFTPSVYVYGSNDSPDVAIAKQIAKGENFELNHVNKAKHPMPLAEHYADIVKDNFYALDGYPGEGIFDFGANMATRRGRAKDAALILNGGGGELYRNFFYLPQGDYYVTTLLDVFYSRYTKHICSELFSENIYRENLKQKIIKALGISGEKISRSQLEYAYPAFRLRYWTARDNSNNNRLGAFLTPFICYETILATLKLPLQFKTHGRFEGDLINKIHPKLAAYPSDYGYRFNEPIPFKNKLQNNMTIYRPIWLRRRSYAIQHRIRKLQLPEAISHRFLSTVLPNGTPYMARFFNIKEIRDAALLGRVLTLEYLFAHLQVK